MASSLSLEDKGVGLQGCVESLQKFIKDNGRLPTALNLTKNHAIGVDGLISISESWLVSTNGENKEETLIEALNISSCSVGRTVNASTGALVLTDTAMKSLGNHGRRLLHIDLSWNDLNTEAVEALVRGLLKIEGPGFEAESYNPATLIPSRACALESLKLKGNSICDGGVKWIARLVQDPTSTLKSSPSNLKTLDLYQCAIEEAGAEVLCECLTSDSPLNAKLVSLDLRENDVKSWNRALAEAAIKSLSLDDFCGVNFTEVNSKLSKASAGETITLKAGENVMCHGTLALLLSIRPYIIGGDGNNPLTNKTQAESKTVGSILLDLRGNTMCGFYWEEVEAIDELSELLAACVGLQTGKAPQVGGKSAEEGNIKGSSLVAITTVELDDACGLTDKQIRSLYDVCIPSASSLVKTTSLKVNGAEYKPGWSCSIM